MAGRTWTLSVDAVPGNVIAVMHDLNMGGIGVGHGERYAVGVSMASDWDGPPKRLSELKRELEARGYLTSF